MGDSFRSSKTKKENNNKLPSRLFMRTREEIAEKRKLVECGSLDEAASSVLYLVLEQRGARGTRGPGDSDFSSKTGMRFTHAFASHWFS